jgi:hypothetical protein
MVYLTMTPFISHIRAYIEPDGYARRLPYFAITTVAKLSEKVAYLCAAVGDVNRETWRETLALLKVAGFETVLMERHGVLKTVIL